jgi:hypothetical protein
MTIISEKFTPFLETSRTTLKKYLLLRGREFPKSSMEKTSSITRLPRPRIVEIKAYKFF